MTGRVPPIPEEWSGSTGVPEGGATPFGSGAPSRIWSTDPGALQNDQWNSPYKNSLMSPVRRFPARPVPLAPLLRRRRRRRRSGTPARPTKSSLEAHVVSSVSSQREQTLSRHPKTWLFRPECEKLPERASARCPPKLTDRGRTSFLRRGCSPMRPDQRALNASVKVARRQASRESGRRPPAFLAAAQRRAATDDGRPPVDGR